jgi:hypothetical protein
VLSDDFGNNSSSCSSSSSSNIKIRMEETQKITNAAVFIFVLL